MGVVGAVVAYVALLSDPVPTVLASSSSLNHFRHLHLNAILELAHKATNARRTKGSFVNEANRVCSKYDHRIHLRLAVFRRIRVE